MNIKPTTGLARLSLLLAAVLAWSATTVRAQDAPGNGQNGNDTGQQDGNYDAPDSGQDPPNRVARLSYLDGTVSFQPGGQGDWGAASRNRPVTIGDKIWVDNNSRAELQAGQASIHLSNMTALSFLNLDDQTTQMRLAEGSINFRVRELREGDVYEVDTPNVSFNVTQAGAFRMDVNENGDATRITAIRGEGEVTANGQTYEIHAGERGEFNGIDNVTYFVAAAPAPDDFDRWSNDRDLRDDNSVSARYVSRDVPGYSDLDDNGTWNEEPDYGPVWYPNAADAGWAPYSSGYWNYVGPWGWTWVGYEPWGFAPYHYGRWAFIGNRWGWCPGPYYARPIYGPAFVGFLGGGFGFGFGFGFGAGIGWFPLGFREPFHPWYHTSAIYIRNVNFANTRFRNANVINSRGNFNYAYAHNVRAVTVASRNSFVNGQAINRGAFRMNEAALRGAQVSNRSGLSPTRQSYFGAAGAHGNIARPAVAIQNRSVMARTVPAAGAHLPVRTFGGNSRARFDNAPAMGRAAQTNAAANHNRPPFAEGNTSSSSRQLPNDRPQSHMRNAPADSGGNNRGQAGAGNSRNWAAQGNTTDGGRAPAGFAANSGNSNRPDRDRPEWTGQGNGNSGYSASPRSSSSNNRPDNSNGNRGNSRSYSPPQRTYSSPSPSQSRTYSAPRGYSAPSAPSRSYSPPSRSYSAPSRGSGGGGGSHGGGSGSSHSGGGSHGGGGGSSHSGGSSHGRA